MKTAVLPARCAVAVVCGEHLVAQVFPAAVPIEAFIDNVTELFDEELKRRGLPGLQPAGGYQLHTANGVRLDATRSLDDLGVEDGATVVLTPETVGESFEPQYESLSTGLARVGRRLFEPVGPATAVHGGLGVLAMATAATIGLALRARLVTDAPAPALLLVGAGLLGIGAAALGRRWAPRRTDLVAAFAWLAFPLVTTGVATAPPGRLGAAHVFIGALTAALLACAIVAVTGRTRAVAATVVTLCGIGGALAAVRMWRPIPVQLLGMGVLAALLVLLALAPAAALWAAHIRPPHFGSITGRDLFHRRAGLPADAVAPVDPEDPADPAGLADPADAAAETGADTTPRTAWIVDAAVRANRVLTGICVAAGLVLPVAVWVAVLPERARATGALAGLFAWIFLSRTRAFADRQQAVALASGAAAALCAGVTKLVLAQPAGSASALLLGAAAMVGFGAAALAAALLVPRTKFTPLVRLAIEWLELAAIVVALPLAAWISGLFTWVRMR